MWCFRPFQTNLQIQTVVLTKKVLQEAMCHLDSFLKIWMDKILEIWMENILRIHSICLGVTLNVRRYTELPSICLGVTLNVRRVTQNWCQFGTTWAKLGPNWSQAGTKSPPRILKKSQKKSTKMSPKSVLGASWASWERLEAILGQPGPAPAVGLIYFGWMGATHRFYRPCWEEVGPKLVQVGPPKHV